MSTRRIGIGLSVWLIALAASQAPHESVHAQNYRVDVTPEQATVQGAGEGDILTYHRLVPPEADLAHVESGGFFHPIKTPGGTTVTDLAPEDHQYHRGVFFGWIEMHGDEPADFWGWGELAPAEDRRIVNRAVPELTVTADEARFVADNDWLADGTVMVRERMEARIRQIPGANIIDLEYTLTPTTDITLPQNAFSGFCFRTRTDGPVRAHNPDGPVDLPPPSHVAPESNWPAQPWYAYTIDLEEAEDPAGAAVIDHADNPETLWHNHTGIGLLQPVIVAPGKVHLVAEEPFILRYRVVTFDGEIPSELLDRLAEDWGHNADGP